MKDKTLIVVIAASFVCLAALPFFVSQNSIQSIFQEWGPVETASAVLWFVAAATVVLNSGITVKIRALFTLTFILLGLREMGFQARYTEGTFIKMNYYDNMSGLDHYLIGLLAIFLIAIVTAALIVSIVNYRRGFLQSVAADWLIAGWAVLVFTKVLDRAPAKFRNDLGIQLSESVTNHMMALEEGLEFLGPIIMIVSFWSLAHFPVIKGKTKYNRQTSGY